ncbi:MAG: hypothetical protein L3K10_04185 [Thermoplasmata archaeon]|nr:hypothetical protein [Thermoplasmata archaeon]
MNSPSATLSVNQVVAHLAPTFWAVAVDGMDNPASSTAAALLNATPIKTLRYGAAWIDQTNWSNGCTYVPGCQSASEVPASFGTLCQWLRDNCVLGLPAESNNPSVATALIHWLATQTSWTPSCWAIGNEPQGWTHFNIPWTSWSNSDASTPTAQQFARDAANVTSAIHHVYPKACVVGLEDNDQVRLAGAWTAAVVAAAPNISAVAIHSYPDNHCNGPYLSPGNLTSLARMYGDAVAASGGLPVETHEFNIGGVDCSALGGETAAVFVSANAAQALELGMPQFGYFRFYCSSTQDCMYNSSAHAGTPIYRLYSQLFTHMDIATIRNVTFSSGANAETYGAEGSNNATDASLLLSNAATTSWENISLGGVSPRNWTGAVYSEDTSGAISHSTYEPGMTVTLPPESTAVVKMYEAPGTKGNGTNGTTNATWTVAGRVVLTNSSPTTGLTVDLHFRQTNGTPVELQTLVSSLGNFTIANLSFNGSFAYAGLGPGSYTILNVTLDTLVPQTVLITIVAELTPPANQTGTGNNSGNGTGGGPPGSQNSSLGNNPGGGPPPPGVGVVTPLLPGKEAVLLPHQLGIVLLGMTLFALSLTTSGAVGSAKKAVRARRLQRWKQSLLRRGRGPTR